MRHATNEMGIVSASNTRAVCGVPLVLFLALPLRRSATLSSSAIFADIQLATVRRQRAYALFPVLAGEIDRRQHFRQSPDRYSRRLRFNFIPEVLETHTGIMGTPAAIAAVRKAPVLKAANRDRGCGSPFRKHPKEILRFFKMHSRLLQWYPCAFVRLLPVNQ